MSVKEKALRVLYERGIFMDNIGLLKLSDLTWEEAMSLLDLVISDGWEVLAIKVLPEGVYAFIQERIVEWLNNKL